jgi:hypothetical protein
MTAVQRLGKERYWVKADRSLGVGMTAGESRDEERALAMIGGG